MRRNSIVLKLFAVTVLFFAIILCVFMIGQTVFFKSFYLNMKTSALEKNMEKFSEQYESAQWDSGSITRNINKFADQNNAQIAILDNEGNAKYTPSFEFVLETPDKGDIKIPLNNIIYLEEFQKLKLAVGAEVEVSGFFSDDLKQASFLSSIKNGSEEWENSNNGLFTAAGVSLKELNPVYVLPATTGITAATTTQAAVPDTGVNTKPANNPVENKPTAGTVDSSKTAKPSVTLNSSSVAIQGLTVSQGSFRQLKGKIVSLDIPEQITQITNYSKDLLWSSIGYWNSLHMLNKISEQPGKTSSFHYTSPSNGMDNIVLVKPITINNRITEYLFAVSSLQPVGEAVGAMESYYLYAFIAAMVLIAGMALLFSRFVARPLIKMNRVAVKMANFDFSEEIKLTSGDELGSLAASLNRLSKNLGESLGELKTANEQLKLDIEKEKELEVMRKEFVSSVSHELKTPLGVIKGFAEGIKDNIAEEKKGHYLNVILEEIEKMDVLVLDLLDLAKLESNTYKLDPENFCITDLMKEAEGRLSNRIIEKNLQIQHEFQSEQLQVHGDLRRIEQVVTNVFDNAIRYADFGGAVKIGIQAEDNNAVISIENSGSHIPEDELTKIWERFYRAEKSRDRKTGGTGLGLSIVKNILQMHESRFGIENTDMGIKFSFTLKKAG